VNSIISHPLPLIFKPKLDHVLTIWLKVFDKILKPLSLFFSFIPLMKVGKVHYFAHDCLVLGGKVNSHGLPCVLRGFLFLLFDHPNFRGAYFSHFSPISNYL
jgi:hypothetical protein